MLYLVRALLIAVLLSMPTLASADDPSAGAAGVALPSADDSPPPPSDDDRPPLSPLHPLAGTREGFVSPSIAGDWRGRISVNGWLINELDVWLEEGGSSKHINLGFGWIITNLEYYFPVDVEIRKGSFGAFATTLFFKLEGSVPREGILLPEIDFSDQGYLIDVGLSYELASWKLGDKPGGPAVTLEPFAAARLLNDPFSVTLLRSGVITDFGSTVPIIGLRTFWDLDEHWNIRVEGDYGGFGVDDNHQTWRAVGLIGYRWPGFGLHWNLQVGYRAMRAFELHRGGAEATMDLRGANAVFSVEF